jgi:hypothetical protein
VLTGDKVSEGTRCTVALGNGVDDGKIVALGRTDGDGNRIVAVGSWNPAITTIVEGD